MAKKVNFKNWIIPAGIVVFGTALFRNVGAGRREAQIESALKINDGKLFGVVRFASENDVDVDGQLIPLSALLKLGADGKLRVIDIIFLDQFSQSAIDQQTNNLAFVDNPVVVDKMKRFSDALAQSGVVVSAKIQQTIPPDFPLDKLSVLATNARMITAAGTTILPLTILGRDIIIQARLQRMQPELSVQSQKIVESVQSPESQQITQIDRELSSFLSPGETSFFLEITVSQKRIAQINEDIEQININISEILERGFSSLLPQEKADLAKLETEKSQLIGKIDRMQALLSEKERLLALPQTEKTVEAQLVARPPAQSADVNFLISLAKFEEMLNVNQGIRNVNLLIEKRTENFNFLAELRNLLESRGVTIVSKLVI
jgi:hypothetical protein